MPERTLSAGPINNSQTGAQTRIHRRVIDRGCEGKTKRSVGSDRSGQIGRVRSVGSDRSKALCCTAYGPRALIRPNGRHHKLILRGVVSTWAHGPHKTIDDTHQIPLSTVKQPQQQHIHRPLPHRWCAPPQNHGETYRFRALGVVGGTIRKHSGCGERGARE